MRREVVGSDLRAKKRPEHAPKIRKNGAKIFSFWREKFSEMDVYLLDVLRISTMDMNLLGYLRFYQYEKYAEESAE